MSAEALPRPSRKRPSDGSRLSDGSTPKRGKTPGRERTNIDWKGLLSEHLPKEQKDAVSLHTLVDKLVNDPGTGDITDRIAFRSGLQQALHRSKEASVLSDDGKKLYYRSMQGSQHSDEDSRDMWGLYDTLSPYIDDTEVQVVPAVGARAVASDGNNAASIFLAKKIETARKDLGEAGQEGEDLENQLSEARGQVDRLKGELAAAQNDVDTLSQRAVHVEKKKHDANGRIAIWENALACDKAEADASGGL